MTAVDGAQRMRVHVRPKRSLLGEAFAAILLGTTPIFAVVYWFTSTHGGMELAIIVHAVVIAIGLLLVWRQLRVFCAVTDDELVGNGIFTPLVRVKLASIRRVQLVPTYLGAAPEPVLQLLVTGDEGRRLFRMRGNFWRASDLRELAAALPVPAEETREVITMSEFFVGYPGSAYWFENRRPLQVAIATVLLLVALAAAVWIMNLLGLPIRFL
ncbi:hypothetical protein [Homoserinibacter gongjuensis]|uniref:PH domain-containing protein n=1 Tax=Homoserinibacter gongjuensis TaxID=1162968 RepID=A0ABQ6JQI0_9MICO|nr:hypothetical protein [Homoserinibacter gongjuensis]GMA90179.1 hypothetical protein GCM10025869_07080 [Homoserinibacter gongjuensis]